MYQYAKYVILENMSFRAWLSLITVVLLAVILFATRHELVRAWELLSQVNLWILLLMIPLQMVVYYSAGEMIFSYLRGKGQIKSTKWAELVRISLEGNFVNHIFPSGGVSGVSYLTWRLGALGVHPGRAAMAQVVRHASGFVAYILLLLISLFAVTLDGTVNRWMILASAILFGTMLFLILAFIYLLSSKRRIDKFAAWVYDVLNMLTRKFTMGKKRKLLKAEAIEVFLNDMHRDFNELRHDKKLLKNPILWGLVYTVGDAGLFMIAFWALGEVFNPAPIIIAYGVATLVGMFVLTPGGAGAYEAVMVTFLAFAGIAGGVAIAGILLARVIILLGTVSFGYVFYQRAISSHKGDENVPEI